MDGKGTGSGEVALFRLILLWQLVISVGAPQESPDSNGKDREANSLTYYESILQKHPDMPEARYGAGSSAYNSGDYERALSEFQAALNSRDPQLRARTFYNLGNTLFKQGRFKESLETYRRALELDPGDLDGKYNYELARRRIEQQESSQSQSSDESGRSDESSPEEKERESSDVNPSKSEHQPSPQESHPSDRNEPGDRTDQMVTKQNQHQENGKEGAEAILNALKSDERNLMKRRLIS
ncbi:MAG: tetratricopeptide repeat protein, partial [Fidelibacterota bacterium]